MRPIDVWLATVYSYPDLPHDFQAECTPFVLVHLTDWKDHGLESMHFILTTILLLTFLLHCRGVSFLYCDR